MREEHPYDWPLEEDILQKRRELNRHLEEEKATARRNQKHYVGITPQAKVLGQLRTKQKELELANEKVKTFEKRRSAWAQKAAAAQAQVTRLERELERLRYPRGRPAEEKTREEKGDADSWDTDPDAINRAQFSEDKRSSLESLPFAQQAGKIVGDRVDSLVRTAGRVIQQQKQAGSQNPSFNIPGQPLGPVRMPAGGILAH